MPQRRWPRKRRQQRQLRRLRRQFRLTDKRDAAAVSISLPVRLDPNVGAEMKLGVLTSLIGTPFFFWLVVRLRKTAP